MDVGSTSESPKGSTPRALSDQPSDQKELAWAFLGLILWSAVVFVGIFSVSYLVGHSLLHWW
jgi:hypothetical protein